MKESPVARHAREWRHRQADTVYGIRDVTAQRIERKRDQQQRDNVYFVFGVVCGIAIYWAASAL